MRVYDAAHRFLGRALRAHWIAVSQPLELELQRHFGERVHRVANAVSVQPPSRTPADLRVELGIDSGESCGVDCDGGARAVIEGPSLPRGIRFMSGVRSATI